MLFHHYGYTTLLLALLASAIFSSQHNCLAFTSVLSTSTRSNNGVRLHLRSIVDDIESKALTASEAWDVYVTSFLPTADAVLVQEQLGGRGDVACFRVGGATASSRSRFVFTNPELGMTTEAAEQEYCVVLCVDNAYSEQVPWANMLTKIGVDLDNVGDVLVSDDGSTYLAVSPEVAKQCSRLLPKEVVGAGVTVRTLDPGEAMPEAGELQQMEVQRLDKRAQKRK